MKWAEEVAHAMIKAGQREMPEGISAFPTIAEYSSIQDLFPGEDSEGATLVGKKTAHEQKESSVGKLEKK